MRLLLLSAFYAALITLSGFGIYCGVGYLLIVFQGGDAISFIGDCFKASLFGFAFFWWLFYKMGIWVGQANQKPPGNPDKSKSDSDLNDRRP